MKFHFGHGAVLGLILFIAYIIFLITKMMGERVDLVEKNYYEKGLEYQKVIDIQEKKRQDYVLTVENQSLMGSLKEPLNVQEAQVRFYRPSDSRLDTLFSLPLNENGNFSLSLPYLQSGLWRITVMYQANGQGCFQEEDIVWP